MGAETALAVTAVATVAGGLLSSVAGLMGKSSASGFSFTPPTDYTDYTQDTISEEDIEAENKRKQEELDALERQNALTGDAGVAEDEYADTFKSYLR